MVSWGRRFVGILRFGEPTFFAAVLEFNHQFTRQTEGQKEKEGSGNVIVCVVLEYISLA